MKPSWAKPWAKTAAKPRDEPWVPPWADVYSRSVARRMFLYICVAIAHTASTVEAEEVFSSSAHLQILTEGEKNMLDAVAEYISYERKRLGDFERYFTMFLKRHHLVDSDAVRFL